MDRKELMDFFNHRPRNCLLVTSNDEGKVNVAVSYLKGFVTFAYKTGWRFSEISSLKWNQVDLTAGPTRPDRGGNQNTQARTDYMGEK